MTLLQFKLTQLSNTSQQSQLINLTGRPVLICPRDTYGMLEGLRRRSRPGSGPSAGLVVFRHRRLLVRVGVHVLSDAALLVMAVTMTVSTMVMGMTL